MPTDPAFDRTLQAEQLRVDEARRHREAEAEALVQAIAGIRADIDAKLRELAGQCDRLHQAARRLQSGDGAEARFRHFATAHQRLTGAMGQALKRAQATERLLGGRQLDQRDAERREREEAARERVKEAVQSVFDLQLPRENDFETLFGEEVVHAS